MLAGNPSFRNSTSTGGLQGICHRCNGSPPVGYLPCDPETDTLSFPQRPCPGGIRASVIFPSCWDGKNLDSPDHSSHMAYAPGSSGRLAGSQCPESHPVRVPQLMYEVNWDTRAFNDPEYFLDGKQPFVYSFGDG